MWKIMIADDEPFIRDGLRTLIPWEQMNCELICAAENGAKLIEQMQEGHPDIVITDIKMPEMDGLSVASYIQENCPEIQVIILSAYADFEYAKKAISYGVSDYVLKVSLLEDLPQALEKVIQKLEKQNRDVQKENQMQKSASGEDLYQKMLRYVEMHYTTKITLEDMSGELHANKSYLSRLFKSRSGVNLFDEIITRRVEKAKEYIQTTNMKIYEISEATGFDDTAYFSRVFKKHTGMSPKEYESSITKHEQGES
ncbi:MAG: response regulator [Hespellia sp.]|nr:response regulator [Hespellia sp.]